jgi:hypothetical protein
MEERNIMKGLTNRVLVLILLVATVGTILVINTAMQQNVSAQQEFQQPTVVSGDVLTPASTPVDNREVAILDLVIVSAEDGTIETVRLERGRIVRRFAPNVFGLAGAWTVELVGAETVSFGTPDPRQAHVLDEDTDVPHTSTLLTGEVAWELVVPLFAKEQDLGIQEINIYDETGELIFTTPVDRERWRVQ